MGDPVTDANYLKSTSSRLESIESNEPYLSLVLYTHCTAIKWDDLEMVINPSVIAKRQQPVKFTSRKMAINGWLEIPQ